MLPVTQLIVATGVAAVVAAGVAAGVAVSEGAEITMGVSVGVGVGAGLGVALDEHADSTTVAAMASTLMRRIPLSNSVSPYLVGQPTVFVLLPGSCRMVRIGA
jgi:hypothetical protein